MWVPDSVADQVLVEGAARKMALYMREFSQRLEEIDPRLDIFYCENDLPEFNLQEGFHYIVRRNDNGTTSLIQIHDNGAPQDPNEAVLQALHKMDASKRDLTSLFQKEQAQAAAARDKAADDQREEMHGKFAEKADFQFRVQVPVTKDIS